jgi:hypothetical protein
MGTMNRAFNAQQELFFQVRERDVASRKGGKLATVLGRVAAGILLLFLVVSAVVSVVVNVRYGPVARQLAQVAVSTYMVDRVPAVTNAL